MEAIPLQKNNSSEKMHKDNVVKGMASAFAAFAMFAVMMVSAKMLSEHYHVAEIAFYRNVIAFFPLILVLLIKKDFSLFKTKKPKAVIIRSIVGALSLIATFAAFAYLPMAEATVLLFTTTLLTPILAFVFLKEVIGPRRWMAILVGLLGVIIMVGPSGQISLIGTIFGLIAASMHAFMHTLLRYLKTENPLTVTFYFVFIGILVAGAFMPFVASPIHPDTYGLLLLGGISGLVAQFFLTIAFKYAPAALVIPFNYTGLIWATGFDIVLWASIPGWPVFLGGSIIIISKIYFIYREHKQEQEKPTS